jgi:hypothetical protein
MNRLERITEDIVDATERIEGFHMGAAQKRAYQAIFANHINAAKVAKWIAREGYCNLRDTRGSIVKAVPVEYLEKIIQSYLDEEVKK